MSDFIAKVKAADNLDIKQVLKVFSCRKMSLRDSLLPVWNEASVGILTRVCAFRRRSHQSLYCYAVAPSADRRPGWECRLSPRVRHRHTRNHTS